LPIVGYGTHQSVLQRFHPIKLDVGGSDIEDSLIATASQSVANIGLWRGHG
jgi:hypothetical protein